MHERADGNTILKLFSADPSTKTTSDFNVMIFFAGKASANLKSLETSKPKTTSDFNAMNLSRGKQAPIITSIKTRIESIKNE
jgi:hypothetical protein